MKVSLVATVKDARHGIEEFLESVARQTRKPDEIVIVDGGSTDGTVEVLRGADSVTLIEEPGANIARGRNLAVRAATHDVIAVSDADCVLSPDWLERLLDPIRRGADVAMGSYRPLVGGFFEACAAAVSVPELDELHPDRFLPSARSVAFRREIFDAAGRYPEWLDIGEDMFVNLRWRELGARMELAPDAQVWWRPRATLAEHWRQYAAYARGDAIAGMHARRHAIRFGVYAGLAAALASRRRAPLVLSAAAGALYAARPVFRARRLAPPPRPPAAAVAVIPALLGFTDVAKMTGYVSGLLTRRGEAPR